jgi:hypothetical protein
MDEKNMQEMVFISREMGFISHEMDFISREMVFKNRFLVFISREMVFISCMFSGDCREYACFFHILTKDTVIIYAILQETKRA